MLPFKLNMKIEYSRRKWGRKYYVIVKVDGKIRSRRRWGKFTLADARKKFADDNTLRQDARRLSFNTKTLEISKERLRKQKSKFMVEASTRVGRRTVTARSHIERWEDVQIPKDQARRNLMHRVAEALNLDYDDTDAAVEYIATHSNEIHYRIVKYHDL